MAELRKHGVRLRIQDQPFRILLALLENPGEVVSREELVRRLWPDGTFVDFERSLNAAINRLRQVLSDSAERPRYVETVARRGYRFIAPVEAEPEVISMPAEPVQPSEPMASPEPSAKRRPYGWLAITAAIVVVVAIAAFLLRDRGRTTLGPTLVRVTSDPGLTTEPTVSPDGKLIAYVSDRSGPNLNLWVQQLKGGAAVQLTHEQQDVHSPSFSPDGTNIVYRSDANGGGVYVIPAIGGTPRRVAPGGRDPRYSPDGKWIAYWSGSLGSSVPNAQPYGVVFLISSQGGTPQRVGRELPSAGYPVWSPDSRFILVTVDPHHSTERSGMDWFLLPIDGGVPIRTHAMEKLQTSGVGVGGDSEVPKISSWTADELLFSAKTGDTVNIWKARMSLPSGALDRISRITSGTNLEVEGNHSADGSLTFASLVRNVSIYQLRGDVKAGVFGPLERVTNGTGSEYTPSMSDDGRLMAFTCGTQRSICVKRFDTGEQLTITAGGDWNPQITHDGSRIVYTNDLYDAPDSLFLIRTSGGTAEKLLEEGGWGFGWSHDNGHFLYRKVHSIEIHSFDISAHTDHLFAANAPNALYQTKFSPDDRWTTIESVSNDMNSRLYIAPVSNNAVAPVPTWIPVGFSEGWDDKPRWSASGDLLYFLSDHDGFRCLWAQRLDMPTKRPRGQPFPVHHFHSARLSPANVGLGFLETAVAPDKIIINLGELTGNIWAMKQR